MFGNSLLNKDYCLGTFDIAKVDSRKIELATIKTNRSIWKAARPGSYSGFFAEDVTGCYSFYLPGRNHDNVMESECIGTILGIGFMAIVGGLMPTNINIFVEKSLEQFDLNKSEMSSYSVNRYDGKK